MERLISRPIPHQLLHDPDAPYLVLPTLKGHILFTLASARPKQRSWQRRRDRQFQMFQDSADNADQWIGLRRKEDTSHWGIQVIWILLVLLWSLFILKMPASLINPVRGFLKATIHAHLFLCATGVSELWDHQ